MGRYCKYENYIKEHELNEKWNKWSQIIFDCINYLVPVNSLKSSIIWISEYEVKKGKISVHWSYSFSYYFLVVVAGAVHLKDGIV